MKLYLPLVAILLVQGSLSIGIVSPDPTRPAIWRQNTKQKDWEAIIALSDRAYATYDEDKAEGRRLFAEAAARLEAYIRKYEARPATLSYLRALVRLGALYQNADNLNQARIVFEQCERHNAFNSPNATLRVENSRAPIKIATYVKGQLYFLADRPQPDYKAAYEVVRRSGSSRGDEIAPQFTIPSPRRPRSKK
jgi:hypothetical protein